MRFATTERGCSAQWSFRPSATLAHRDRHSPWNESCGQAKATGESYVATAGQQTAEEYAGRATNDADRIRREMKAAGLEVAATDLQHQAAEPGEDAQRAAEAALAAEAKLLGTDQ